MRLGVEAALVEGRLVRGDVEIADAAGGGESAESGAIGKVRSAIGSSMWLQQPLKYQTCKRPS